MIFKIPTNGEVQEITRFKTESGENEMQKVAAWSQDNRYIVTGGEGMIMKLW